MQTEQGHHAWISLFTCTMVVTGAFTMATSRKYMPIPSYSLSGDNMHCIADIAYITRVAQPWGRSGLQHRGGASTPRSFPDIYKHTMTQLPSIVPSLQVLPQGPTPVIDSALHPDELLPPKGLKLPKCGQSAVESANNRPLITAASRTMSSTLAVGASSWR